MNTYNSTPPPEFVWSNMTSFNREWIQERWYIYIYVRDANTTKKQAFIELANELGKSVRTIETIYYKINEVHI